MNKYIFLFVLILFSGLLYNSETSAQQFVYTPINPSFGGNPYNGTWMLSSAQAQNNITEERKDLGYQGRSSIDDFTESLNRQILSQLSRQLISNSFGEDGLEEGRYELGDYIIDVGSTADGVSITIFDVVNGSETNILIPYF